MGDRDCRIYVGNLPDDCRDRDVEDVFEKYGRIRSIDIKAKGRAPAFAFVDFEDPADAEDAVRGRDGYSFEGQRLRVEFPRGVGPRGPGGRPIYDRDGGRSRGGDDRYSSRSRNPPPRRSSYRVKITGLPSTGSWQDVKDHLRDAGEVCYANVHGDGTGVAEFIHRDDMKRAIRKLDDTKFRSHEGETAYVRISEASDTDSPPRGSGRRSRSRSPKYSPRRSRSRSPPSRRGGGSRSRSVSHSKSRSRSRSRSRS